MEGEQIKWNNETDRFELTGKPLTTGDILEAHALEDTSWATDLAWTPVKFTQCLNGFTKDPAYVFDRWDLENNSRIPGRGVNAESPCRWPETN